MKTVSINPLSGIKALMAYLLIKPQREPLKTEKTRYTRKSTYTVEESSEATTADLSLLQRKAYTGQFMAGSVVLMHPALF